MGYTTTFKGCFKFDKPLSDSHKLQFKKIAEARHEAPAPSTYCQWVVNRKGTKLHWDKLEKCYAYMEWLHTLIILTDALGYKLNGKVQWQGENKKDQGIISIKENRIKANCKFHDYSKAEIVYYDTEANLN